MSETKHLPKIKKKNILNSYDPVIIAWVSVSRIYVFDTHEVPQTCRRRPKMNLFTCLHQYNEICPRVHFFFCQFFLRFYFFFFCRVYFVHSFEVFVFVGIDKEVINNNKNSFCQAQNWRIKFNSKIKIEKKKRRKTIQICHVCKLKIHIQTNKQKNDNH